MKRKRIVFASVLKPVDDPRTYLKLAKSLVPSGKYDVNIIGFPGKAPIIDPEINFIPLEPFPRKSLKRLLITTKIEKLIRRLEPDLLIINTHELLGMAKRLKNKDLRIIYDVRENYYQNILHRKHFFSRPLARLTRRKETGSVKFIDHYILAERCYADQLAFTRNKATILENKAIMPESATFPGTARNPLTFVFTGTLANHTGISECIEMVEQVRKIDPSARLLICGNSFDTSFLNKLRNRITKYPWIEANISEAPLPYDQILRTLVKADAAVISYESWVYDKMPSKLYEYLAHEIPIVFIKYSSIWKSFCDTYRASVVYKSDPEQLIKELADSRFYMDKPGAEVHWEHEALDFRALVDNLLNS
ncbi:glycosyltransferase [Fulvivirga sedimenti]|uniref:Glycosyltransferase n=1 Tax=Fulvivirga sedimenti TaxID=2879465 RepID=A0A9X1HPX8_9BACT|nr:glycosyltransferase [Fulvivirga sedimenti]MCA6074624.1 glycosyltransferase [Fulvivirga sedimenti]MCA6075801.1 glycosyltransferase [Fulvivirga sedimenti]MCA6076929.1 glycosyltransferase [Fulvivirga sedimenti]